MKNIPVRVAGIGTADIELDATISHYNWHPVALGSPQGIARFAVSLVVTSQQLERVLVALIPVSVDLMDNPTESQIQTVARSISIPATIAISWGGGGPTKGV